MTTRKFAQSLVALLCIFCTLHAEAAIEASSTSLASQGISQAVVISNDEISSTHVTATQLANLAATLNRYIPAAEADGTLAKATQVVLSYSGGTGKLPTATYEGLRSYGFKADEAQVNQYMSSVSPETLASVQELVRSIGMKLILQRGVTALNLLAKEMAENPSPTLHLADFNTARFMLAMCRLEGEFLAVAAIGAVASLGGVNPLGDLLGAIGAVGAFV